MYITSIWVIVVLDTTKVQIFKQITTSSHYKQNLKRLFQIPQRYRFSSKSQLKDCTLSPLICCFRYHKGTDFQANHNMRAAFLLYKSVVLDTTKVQIFKQITTQRLHVISFNLLFQIPQRYRFSSKSQHEGGVLTVQISCFRYHKGTDFQANHNLNGGVYRTIGVVLDTTKVQIFKQITTLDDTYSQADTLFQIPQRYRFSSKSQPSMLNGAFQSVVLDTTKVQIFKQITTATRSTLLTLMLFQIPQRYRFSSKSQLLILLPISVLCCFRYHKGTDFQANHNSND